MCNIKQQQISKVNATAELEVLDNCNVWQCFKESPPRKDAFTPQNDF